MAKWQRMWDGQDNQEVGLEAAILERKRNSSLVEQLSCAEDVAGLKPCTEAAGVRGQRTEIRGQTDGGDRVSRGRPRGVQAGVSDLSGCPSVQSRLPRCRAAGARGPDPAGEQVDLRQPGRGVCPPRAEPGGLPSL